MMKVPSSVSNLIPVIQLTTSHFSDTAVLAHSIYNWQEIFIRGDAAIIFITNRGFKLLYYQTASQTLTPEFNDLAVH
jgi:hypothetical protein